MFWTAESSNVDARGVLIQPLVAEWWVQVQTEAGRRGWALMKSASAGLAVPAPTALSAADLEGKWNIRAVPLTGDMTPSVFVMTATAGNNGWTQTFGYLAAPVAIRITIDGDSLTTEAGPYESVRLQRGSGAHKQRV